MITAVIWYCVFNLSWAESCRVYAFSGISLVTFFYSTFTNVFLFLSRFYVFSVFLLFFNVFYICDVKCHVWCVDACNDRSAISTVHIPIAQTNSTSTLRVFTNRRKWWLRPRYVHYVIVIICPIAIAYSMGQIIKSVCVCVCVSVRQRALSRSYFSIDFHQNWHRRTNPRKEERVRSGSTSHHPFPYFVPKTPILGQEVLQTHANIK